MDISASQIIAFRMGERITLTLVVLVISLVVMVGFWRTVQSVRVEDGGKLGVAGSFVLSTPIFVLMTIVCYAWVSLAHPISVGVPVVPVADSQSDSAFAANDNGIGGFIGASSFDAPTSTDPANARHEVTEQIRTLNCLASGQDLNREQKDHLGLAKFALMTSVWSDDWGDPKAFIDWAQNLSLSDPNAAARTVFDAVRSPC